MILTGSKEHGAVDGDRPREVGWWAWESYSAGKARGCFGARVGKERVWGILIISRVGWHQM